MKLYVLDQSADVNRNCLDLVIREIKIGQRWQLQQFPWDSVEIVVLQMDGMKFGKPTREGMKSYVRINYQLKFTCSFAAFVLSDTHTLFFALIEEGQINLSVF